MAKISSFIIGLVLMGLVIVPVIMLIANIGSNYSLTYDQNELSVYNQLDNLSSQAQDIQNRSESITAQTGVVDVLNNMFASGYSALKITLGSINIFNNMLDRTIETSHLGAYATILKVGLVVIVLITIFVGIFMSTIVKRES